MAEPVATEKERPVFVHVMIVVAALCFIAGVALLYWSWFSQPKVSTMIDVIGDKSMDGTTIDLMTSAGEKIASGRFDEDGGYEVKLALDPRAGVYLLRITPKDAAARYVDLGLISKNKLIRVDLTRAVAPPTSVP